jgi:hypothetical protein
LVQRTKAAIFDVFIGKVDDVKIVDDPVREEEEGQQYHIEMSCLDKEIKGETGKLHEWIRISAKATDDTVPEGSVLDKYLEELESVLPDARKEGLTIMQVLSLMKGKVFQFRKKKLGRSFEGHEAKPYWTPVRLLTQEEVSKVKKA